MFEQFTQRARHVVVLAEGEARTLEHITDEALEAAAELANRYISDRFLPAKAIDLIDEASHEKLALSIQVLAAVGRGEHSQQDRDEPVAARAG